MSDCCLNPVQVSSFTCILSAISRLAFMGTNSTVKTCAVFHKEYCFLFKREMILFQTQNSFFEILLLTPATNLSSVLISFKDIGFHCLRGLSGGTSYSPI